MMKGLKYKTLVWFNHFGRIVFNTKRKNLAVYFILTVLFIVEVLIYYLTTFTWHGIHCSIRTDCTKILIVADPQLIGLHNENSALLTPFSIWDSDRYLAKTFSYAFDFAQPDVVVFLGDLFDEGSTGSDYEFQIYVDRLLNIFSRKSYNSVHQIWLPGDNDIGGEFNDVITGNKIDRFEHAFVQPDIVTFKNLKFLKINRLTNTIPVVSEPENFAKPDDIVVGLSHIPLLMSPATFVNQAIDKLHPHLLFTAHTHKSMTVTLHGDPRQDRMITPIRPDDKQIVEYYLGAPDVYEIIVPTCSYRMGTDKIGYGFAVIEHASVQYTVLWSPSRFPQLLFYGILILFGIIYLTCRCGFNYCIGNNNEYTRVGHIA